MSHRITMAKQSLLYIVTALVAQLIVSAGAAQATGEVTLYSNAYSYPAGGDRAVRNISKDGLTNWSDAGMYTQTYFYPQQKGKLSIALMLKAAAGNSSLQVQLDGAGKIFTVPVKQSADYVTIPVGDVEIESPIYHFVRIKGISKTGANFPDIKSLVLTGPAAEGLLSNNSQYKGAPATHLRYETTKDSAIAWFYNEVTVPAEAVAVNAYYMTNGFSGGYLGVQLNNPTERRFIFSVWSNYNTNDPKQIPAEYRVSLLKKGDNVDAGDFGNEGSGGHSHLKYSWKQGSTYKFLIGAKPAGDHTIYTGYYFAPEIGQWKLISRWDKTKTGGKLMSGLYSFVENFGPNGNDFFKAEYGNQWICTTSGTWIELTKSTFTTTASPTKHPRFDYGAGVEDNKFYMFSGGFKLINNLAPRSVIERKPNGMAPKIDFAALEKLAD